MAARGDPDLGRNAGGNGAWGTAQGRPQAPPVTTSRTPNVTLAVSPNPDPTKVGAPRRLVVVTATGFAYERTDGVAVVPITALGP